MANATDQQRSQTVDEIIREGGCSEKLHDLVMQDYQSGVHLPLTGEIGQVVETLRHAITTNTPEFLGGCPTKKAGPRTAQGK